MPKPVAGFNKHPENINRKGAPKRTWTWSGLLEQAAEALDEKSGKRFKELIAKRIIIDSVNGNTATIKILLDRMDGQPKQSTDITSGGKPLLGGKSQVPIQDGDNTNNSDKEASKTE